MFFHKIPFCRVSSLREPGKSYNTGEWKGGAVGQRVSFSYSRRDPEGRPARAGRRGAGGQRPGWPAGSECANGPRVAPEAQSTPDPLSSPARSYLISEELSG